MIAAGTAAEAAEGSCTAAGVGMAAATVVADMHAVPGGDRKVDDGSSHTDGPATVAEADDRKCDTLAAVATAGADA